MKSFKMNVMMAVVASFALLAVACGSAPASSSAPVSQQDTPMLSQTQAASQAAEKTADKQRVLDWKDRGLGEVASPEWLLPAQRGNFTVFKRDWQITGDKRLQPISVRAERLNAAQTIADVQYAARLANELKQKVLSRAAITLQSDDQFAAAQDAATETKVDIAGQQRLTDFWQQYEITNSQGRTTRYYMYYVVYSCDNDVWDKLVAKYLFDIVDKVPQQEAKQKIAGMFAEIAADSKNEKEKSEQVFREEVQAQLKALQTPMSASEQRAAYRSGDSAKIAAASVTKADTDYISALAALAGIE
ncbi:hypothetical protein AGMMS50293_08980 [Spirochaetia bacterium]|nr:hypothetical protein AGMMS50293_08980 [Spirochaetia bacterium]